MKQKAKSPEDDTRINTQRDTSFETREKFLPQIPRLNSLEIQSLVKKFPPNESRYAPGLPTSTSELNTDPRRTKPGTRRRYCKRLDHLVRAADQLRNQNQSTFKQLNYDLITQKVKTNDFLRTQDLVKLSDYSVGKMI